MAAITASISFYKKINYIKSTETIPLDMFFSGIQDGTWEDYAHEIRKITDKKAQQERKAEIVPSVTLSGLFNVREDNKIVKHSGVVGMDVDAEGLPTGVTVSECRDLLKDDKYVLAAFITISGLGLCIVFKVNSAKHNEAFRGISQYLFETYKIVCDPTSVNVSRSRYVSYDPDIYVNDNAIKFLLYPKEKAPKRIEKVLFEESDFHDVINEIQKRRLNLVESYYDWYRMAFALASRFGAQGERYFHILSQYSSKYNAQDCERQYNVCCKRSSSSGISISTFYWMAKNAGLEVYSARTKMVALVAAQGKKSGLTPEAVAANLLKYEDISDAAALIAQVFSDDINVDEDTLIDQLEVFLRQRYEMKRNLITRKIEVEGKPLEKVELNSIFLKAKRVLEKINYELFDRIVNSDFVKDYNPLLDFFADNIERGKTGNSNIEALFNCISTTDPAWAVKYGMKWIIGCISAAHGEHSPLYLVLSGKEVGTGKTQWWRRLLPKEIKKYYAESKLIKEKDDEILMTQKWIIMDDEMGGKTKKENIHIRNLTSVDTFSLREPYGHGNVDLKRLANLGGTTNEDEVVAGDVDNRRVIPIRVFDIDHEAYNKIDKTEMWMEAYHLYINGFEWEVKRGELEEFNKDKSSFEVVMEEKELLMKYFDKGNEEMTATEIKVYLENMTRQRLTVAKLGRCLGALGFQQVHVKWNDTTKRCWLVKRNLPESDNDIPF